LNRLLFTAAGCARCNIAKKFLREKGLEYEELDIGGEGKDRFARFYRENRGAIFRGREGIEFPVLADGAAIRQGVAAVIAHVLAGGRLDGFFEQVESPKGWVGGIRVSKGARRAAEPLAEALAFLAKNGLKLELETDGRNAAVLKTLLEKGIGDRAVMDLKGPAALYGALLGAEADPEEIRETMNLVARFKEHRFETTVTPVQRPVDAPQLIAYLTPEEIEETARWLKEATGSEKQPYFLRRFDPEKCADERLKAAGEPPPDALFRCRAAARKHQVLTEIMKPT
jgi:pyruvate formate lyase activating enzyme